MRSRSFPAWVGAIALAGLASVGWLTAIGLKRAARQGPAMSAKVGDEVVLERPGGGPVVLAVDEPTYSAMVDAEQDHDEELMALLGTKGRVFRVPSGTRAKVLRSATSSGRVLIRDGASLGFEGWAPAGQIRPAPPDVESPAN